jgi:hypothetical protein
MPRITVKFCRRHKKIDYQITRAVIFLWLNSSWFSSKGLVGGELERKSFSPLWLRRALIYMMEDKKRKYKLFNSNDERPSGEKPCAFFLSAAGCKNGTGCKFMHGPSGGGGEGEKKQKSPVPAAAPQIKVPQKAASRPPLSSESSDSSDEDTPAPVSKAKAKPPPPQPATKQQQK